MRDTLCAAYRLIHSSLTEKNPSSTCIGSRGGGDGGDGTGKCGGVGDNMLMSVEVASLI